MLGGHKTPEGWLNLSELPWPLKVLLFAVALFIIALPYILLWWSNPYNEAVKAYDEMCQASATTDPEAFRPLLDPSLRRASTLEISRWIKQFNCLDRKAEGAEVQFKQDKSGYYWIRVILGGTHQDVRFHRIEHRMYWMPETSE